MTFSWIAGGPVDTGDQGYNFHFKGQFFLVFGAGHRGRGKVKVQDARSGKSIFEIRDEFAEVVIVGDAGDGNGDLAVGEPGQKIARGISAGRGELGNLQVIPALEFANGVDQREVKIAAGHVVFRERQLVADGEQFGFCLLAILNRVLDLRQFRLVVRFLFSQRVQVVLLRADDTEPKAGDDGDHDNSNQNQLVAFFFGEAVHRALSGR